jgi:ABC-type lipoprotein export system ATPase subunit/bifunctional DNA-binding transcriptional regulator/antitoxin component of YhaV-PrlF toxin-antitoxin module
LEGDSSQLLNYPITQLHAMTEPMIICENLVKIYQIAGLEVLALQGLDLTVEQGELMGIVGVSGSGKTTLMNVLGGLVRPSAGRVLVNDQNLLKLSNIALDRYRRTQVGFVWQQGARNLVPYLNARENVELPMMLAGFNAREMRQRSMQLLEMVGLADRSHHHLPHLSGGEQARVAIAVALANKPALLLADEPTGELDSATALTIYEAFQQLNAELGLTILIVSHDPKIARHVQRVMAIRDGKAASETRARRSNGDGRPQTETEHEDDFEELVVLDSAGRLQVPKAYREALGINRRASMEMTAEGLLIRPVDETEQETNSPLANTTEEEGEMKKRGRLRGRLQKWLKRS